MRLYLSRNVIKQKHKVTVHIKTKIHKNMLNNYRTFILHIRLLLA